jgi:hypothetical protein
VGLNRGNMVFYRKSNFASLSIYCMCTISNWSLQWVISVLTLLFHKHSLILPQVTWHSQTPDLDWIPLLPKTIGNQIRLPKYRTKNHTPYRLL